MLGKATSWRAAPDDEHYVYAIASNAARLAPRLIGLNIPGSLGLLSRRLADRPAKRPQCVKIAEGFDEVFVQFARGIFQPCIKSLAKCRHASLSGEHCQTILYTAFQQGCRQRTLQCFCFCQFAFTQSWRIGDDLSPGLREWAIEFEYLLYGLKGAKQDLKRPKGLGCVGYSVNQRRRKGILAIKQDLALVGKVPEESAFRDTGPLCDFCCSRRIEPALAK